MSNPSFRQWWTKERVEAALRRFAGEHGAFGSKRYDQVVAAECVGKAGPDRPYPASPVIRQYWPTFYDAWVALGITPADDCRPYGKRRGRKASSTAVAKPEPAGSASRFERFESRLAALEADKAALLRVVEILADDAPTAERDRDLVRAGIAVGAIAAGGGR